MPDLPIPDSPAEISPVWLSAVLGAPVVSVTTEPIDGGLLARTFRVRPGYASGSEGSAPPSLIAKLPALDPAARAGRDRLYRREVAFYRDLAPPMGSAVPACFAALHDPDSLRSLLLLEDCTTRPGMRGGDNVAGCSLDEAAAVMRAIADRHARWWNNTALLECEWLGTSLAAGPDMNAAHRDSWERFPAESRTRARPSFVETAELLCSRVSGVYAAASRDPWTLTQQDSRLDNLLLGSGPAPEVVTFDWQTVVRGQGARDVTQFLATAGIHGVSQEESWEPLITKYHEALVANGVVYALPDLLRDVRVAASLTVRIAVQALANLDFSGTRGQALATRHVDAANFVAEYFDLPRLLREEFAPE